MKKNSTGSRRLRVQNVIRSTFRVGNEPFAKSYLLVTCGNDRCVKMWRLTVTPTKNEARAFAAEMNIYRIMEKHGSSLTCVRFSANGSYIASSGLDKTTVIWETVRFSTYVLVYSFFFLSNFIARYRSNRILVRSFTFLFRFFPYYTVSSILFYFLSDRPESSYRYEHDAYFFT